MDKRKIGSLDYIPSFDGLRGIAVIFVLLFHGSYGFFAGGWIGVDLFFVLSGFLITSLLLNELKETGDISFKKFYARRCLRLLPPLVICIIMANLFSYFQKGDLANSNQPFVSIGALFYFLNFIENSLHGNMAHLWSLSVEEHFYIFWPVVIFTLHKSSFRNAFFILVGIILIVSVLRVVVYYFDYNLIFGRWHINSNRATFCKIDGILMGALLALYFKHKALESYGLFVKTRGNFNIGLLLFVFAVVLFTIDEYSIHWRSGGFLLTNLLCLAMVLEALRNRTHYLLTTKIVSWLGRRSYGIYLYHFPIFLMLENLREPNNPINLVWVTVLRFGCAFILAEISFMFIEQPIIKYKRKFEVYKK